MEEKKKAFFQIVSHKISSFHLDDVELIRLLSLFLFVAALGLFVFLYTTKNPAAPSGIIDPSSQEEMNDACDVRRALDGVCLSEEGEEFPKLVAIMIENHPEARPQSGLARAAVVYEAPVEANYTRFMAFFPEGEEVSDVGPVRSARPYYLDWLSEYGTPLYMHVGGSPDALDGIEEKNINDLNEFYNGSSFWREEARYAPHNVYASSALWEKALDTKSSAYTKTLFTPWLFEDQEPCTEICVTQITASFLPPTYEAVWKYNTSTERYDRYQDGVPHTDSDGTPIVADTVIVQRVETEVVDDVGRIVMETIGEGEAMVFVKGKMTKGTWWKEFENSRTEWIGENGEPIALQPGKMWVEVVNQRGSVAYQ